MSSVVDLSARGLRKARFAWVVRALFAISLVGLQVAFRIAGPNTKWVYSFLFNNLFLSYLPIEISLHISTKLPRTAFWAMFLLWLFFYPNAPYMLTDLFHVSKFADYIVSPSGRVTSLLQPDMVMWTLFSSVVAVVLMAALLGVWSLDHVAEAILGRFDLRGRLLPKAALVVVITFLAGVGIYLGRFPRMNSVDLFLCPRRSLDTVTTVLSTSLLAFAVLMSVVQTIVWATLSFVCAGLRCSDASVDNPLDNKP